MSPLDLTTKSSVTVPAPRSIPVAGTVAHDRPQNLLAALNCCAASEPLSENALRCVTTDLSTLARLSDKSKGRRHRWSREDIQQQLAQLPCDPTELRPIIEGILPARLLGRVRRTSAGKRPSVTIAKRWTTIKSSACRVLRRTDWIDDDDVLGPACNPEWDGLCEIILDPVPRSTFRVFAKFCSRAGIPPSHVGEDTLERYRLWLLTRTLKLLVGQRVNFVRMTWNRCVRSNPDWPQRLLKPPRGPSPYAQVVELNRAFVADVQAYLAKLRHPDPLDPLFAKVSGPATLVQKHDVLMRAARVLIAAGRDRNSITALRDITRPNDIRHVLLHLYDRLGKGKAWPHSAVYTAKHLRDAARYVVTVDPSSLTPAEIAEIEGFRKLVRVPNTHLLGKKTRERLAALEDPETEERFLRVPDEAFAEADCLLSEGRPSQAAHLHQAALALAIAICKPLRRGMLAKLDTKRHLQRDSRGRAVGLHIPAEEVEKSTVEIEALFSRKLSDRIARHERIYIPIIVKRNATTALFPNPSGKSLHPNQLAQSVVRLVEKSVGIEYNSHLVRHWAASIILDDDPRNGPTVQHLLAHRSPTSKSRYGVPRTRSAHRQYAKLLDRKVAAIRRRRAR